MNKERFGIVSDFDASMYTMDVRAEEIPEYVIVMNGWFDW